MKHQYADYVQAFIEGKPVQCRSGSPDGDWFDMTTLTQFDCYYDFRLRPSEKVVRWLWAWKEKNSGMLWGVSQFLTEKEANRLFHDCEIKKIEWSREEFDE